MTKENLNGICKPFDQCPQARQNYLQGIYPTFCGDYVSICCLNQPDLKFGNSQRISVQSNWILLLRVKISKLFILECKEYTKQVVKITLVAPLSLHTSIKNQQSYEDYKCVLSSTGLIAGGAKAKPGEFPHM